MYVGREGGGGGWGGGGGGVGGGGGGGRGTPTDLGGFEGASGCVCVWVRVGSGTSNDLET